MGTAAAPELLYVWLTADLAATGTGEYRATIIGADSNAAVLFPVATGAGTATSAVPNPSTGRFALLTSFGTAARVQGSVVNRLGQQVLAVNELVPTGCRLPWPPACCTCAPLPFAPQAAA